MKSRTWSSLPLCIKEMVLTEFLYEKEVLGVVEPKNPMGGDCYWFVKKRVRISHYDLFSNGDHKFVSYLLPCKEINRIVSAHIVDGMAKPLWKTRLIYSRLP